MDPTTKIKNTTEDNVLFFSSLPKLSNVNYEILLISSFA